MNKASRAGLDRLWTRSYVLVKPTPSSRLTDLALTLVVVISSAIQTLEPRYWFGAPVRVGWTHPEVSRRRTIR